MRRTATASAATPEPDWGGQAILRILKQLENAIARIEARVSYFSEIFAYRKAAEESVPGLAEKRFETPRVRLVELPVWIDVKDVKEKVGLTEERVRQFVRAGYVRRAKLGKSRQAASLFRTEDILDALERLSRGHEPRKKR